MKDDSTAQPPADAATQPMLFCLDGARAPAELGPSLAQLLALPPLLRERLAEVLLPNLEPLPEDQLDSRIARLCRRHDLNPDVAGPALKATVLLFRQAAMHALDSSQLAQDLAALGGSEELGELLVPLYEQARPDLRREAARATIAAHGKVLAGVEWRVDTLGSSSRGRQLNLPVAMLTFHYLDGERTDRITLQLLPDMVASLREICDLLIKKE